MSKVKNVVKIHKDMYVNYAKLYNRDRDVWFVHNKFRFSFIGVIEEAIRRVTKNVFNHAAILRSDIVDSFFPNPAIFESRERGFFIYKSIEEHFQEIVDGKKFILVLRTGLDRDEQELFHRRFKEILGKRYDYTSIVFHYLFYKLFNKYNVRFVTKSLYCFEAIGYLFGMEKSTDLPIKKKPIDANDFINSRFKSVILFGNPTEKQLKKILDTYGLITQQITFYE